MNTRFLSRKWLAALLIVPIALVIVWLAQRQWMPAGIPVALSTATPAAPSSPLAQSLAPSVIVQQPESPLTQVNRNLQVATTSPQSQAVDVLVYSNITIGFNRPAVVLTDNTDHSQLPQPAHLEPAVPGRGIWTSSNHFQFQPKEPLAGGTTYRVVVEPFVGIEDRKLETALAFTFTTALPSVVNAEPRDSFVRPTTPIKIEFDQAMDVDSTRRAFSLEELSTKRPIKGSYAWADNYKTLRFFPRERLNFDEIYRIAVADSAMPASRQGTLKEPFHSEFATLPLPYIESVYPGPGETHVWVDSEVIIRFSTFMREKSIFDHIHIEPAITHTQIYSSFSPLERTLTLGWPKEPATTYTVTLDAAMLDAFGNRLGDTVQRGVPIMPTGVHSATVFHFTTGDLSTFARLNIDPLTHFSAYTETHVGLYYRNITQSEVSLYQVPLSEFARLSNNQFSGTLPGYQIPDPVENLLWTRRYPLQAKRNTIHLLAIDLTDALDKPVPPGIYLLEVREGGANQQNSSIGLMQAMIVLSNGNVVVKQAGQGQSLAWVTDLRTGNPLVGRPVNFLVNGFLQSTTATDREGIAAAELQLDPQQSNLPVVAVSSEPGKANFAVGSSAWNQGIGLSDFNLPYRNYSDKYLLHFFTDRPIYQPGQRVYWKGIVRRWRGEEYLIPGDEATLTLQLRNSQGTVISETIGLLNEFGTVDGFFELGAESRTGDYYLSALLTHGPGYGVSNSVSFLVAAYRKPEFSINVQSDQAEVVQGDKLRIVTEASYFSGGPLPGAKVYWRLVTSPHAFAWQPPNPGSFYTFSPFDPSQLDADPYASFIGGLVKEGEGVIGEDGRFVLELPANLADSIVSQRWTVDVTVQSSTNQFVSRAVTMIVHRGDYYVGISPDSYVLQRGKVGTINLITLEPDGKIYPQAALDVAIYEYRWNSVYVREADDSYRWQNSLERHRVATDTVQTDVNGLAQIDWTPNQGGQYLITIQGKDAQGNPIRSAQTIWVSDGASASYTAWPQQNHDRLALVADQALYQPGETAHILVPSPFQGKVKALVTVERGGVLEAQTLELESNSAILDIPILESYVPSAYVSVVLFRPATAVDPVPMLRIGYVQLKVDSAAKALQIDVAVAAAKVHPGDTVPYTLTVRNDAGQVVSDTEVTVALIDKAVLSLRELDTRSLLDIFYYERGIGVTTGSTMIINRDRLSQQIGSGQKGGGGGGGGGDGIELRSEFPDLAWWRANYVTDAQGQIKFTIKLPDNLTRWVLLVKAIDKTTHVGETRHEIIATKDLQVRPLLPRFFTAGDQATIGTVLVNATTQRFDDVQVDVTVEGATVTEGPRHFTTTLDAEAQQRINLPITVSPQAAQVVVTMTATAQSSIIPRVLTDAVRIVIPVKRFITPETLADAGMVLTQSLSIPITLPATVQSDAELVVKLEGSLAAGMVDGLQYLEHYPYECNEQSLSRFLPNLFTVRTFRSLGLADAAMERQLNYQLVVGTQRMISRQNLDGGWGYWPGEPSAPFTTAYVLWGLHHARHFGYPINPELFRMGMAYLEQRYHQMDIAELWQMNESAFTLFVLTELGNGNPGQMSVLYDNRARLGLYGKAYLAMAMDKMGNGDESFAIAVNTLIQELLDAAHYDQDRVTWREKQQDYRSMNTDVRTSAIILAALIRLRPTNPILPQAVRGLMAARQFGYWSNTQETAWSIIALTDWLVATQELEGNYTWEVNLNEQALGSGVMNAESLSQKIELRGALLSFLQNEPQRLEIARSNQSGQLYYATQLRYAVDALAVQPINQGITVDRRFEIDDHAVNTATVGDLITMTVRISTSRELHHTLIEMPIPAGSEPVDQRLSTEVSTLGNEIRQRQTWADERGFPVEYSRLWPTYVDIRDDKIALFVTNLPPGQYFVTFPIRATLPGRYRVLPVHAEMMYFTTIMGRSAGDQFEIEEAEKR